MELPTELAIYYEHPHWFEPLFAELNRRGIPYARLNAGEQWYAIEEIPEFSLVINRMSPSAGLRGHGDAIVYTLEYLRALEHRGVRVINGTRAYALEISKSAQLALLEGLELRYPRTRVIHRAAQAPEAAAELRYPVIVKPNVGGSGAGIQRFDDPVSLGDVVERGEVGLGVDSTALVQELIPAAGRSIVRIEVLDGAFLYAIRVHTEGQSFNLCPADICRTADGDTLETAAPEDQRANSDVRVEGFEPPPEVVDQVLRIAAAGGIDVGGVEYLIDERDDQPVFYDINALSNFVAEAPRVVGFDPFERLVDYIEKELDRVVVSARSIR